MNTEELTQKRNDGALHFDAHEFDGLRDVLEKEAEGMFAKLDQFIRENPMTSILIAAAAGVAVASAARRACMRKGIAPATKRS